MKNRFLAQESKLVVFVTVTTTLPIVAPDGTGTTMLVADQLVGVVKLHGTAALRGEIWRALPAFVRSTDSEPRREP